VEGGMAASFADNRGAGRPRPPAFTKTQPETFTDFRTSRALYESDPWQRARVPPNTKACGMYG
ncbi:MAG: hypothetical protein ACXWVS_14275, partial [Hyphomicrobium sp.]